jgi:GNAT superfamily N-acetyltransferase
MEIRSALPLDNKDLKNIFKEAILKGCNNVYGDKVVKAWAVQTNKGFKFVVPEGSFVCIKDERIIAFSGWRPQGEVGDLARVASVFFCPEYVGQGIGKVVLDVVHDDVKYHNFLFTHLYAYLNAVSFYKSQGYPKKRGSGYGESR